MSSTHHTPNPPESTLPFAPGALMNAIGNSLSSPLLQTVLKVKGLYKPGKGVNYNGSYYDILKDEFTEANLALVVPERLRPQLKDGQLIEASVYLSKRFQAATGRIDLLLTLNELLDKKEKTINEEDTRLLAILQKKAKTGYKDADSFIKKRLFEQKPVRVTILVGLTAIIDQDIKHQIREAVRAYEIDYVRINLSQVAEITRALKTYENCDILVMARGGGENMAIFDNPAISESVLQLRCIFMTALGHTVDEPLLQKVADKAFITPTALGQYFHELYNRTIEDLNDSKTKLMADLAKQFQLSYEEKLRDLNDRLTQTTRSSQEAMQKAESKAETQARHLSEINERLAKTKTANGVLAGALTPLALITLYFLIKR